MSKNIKILSIVGIAFGVCAVALSLLELTILGIVLGIAGVIISIIARKKAKAQEASTLLATIGLVVSALGVVTGIVMLVLHIIHENEKDSMFKGAIDAVYYGDK